MKSPAHAMLPEEAMVAGRIGTGRTTEPDVFLSSAFLNFMDDRAEIRALDPARIWTIEDRRPDLDPRKGVPSFAVVDALVRQIRQSNVFICVLRDRYGSSVFEGTESVSFLETEIYQAALFHNSAHFLVMEPFSPDIRLTGLIQIINAIRPGLIADRAMSKPEVFDRIKEILGDTRNIRHRSRTLSLGPFVGRLALVRGHPKPDVEFFDRVFRSVSEKPDRHHIRYLLDDLNAEPGIERRLTRMWIALRELSAAPYDRPEFSEYLPLWNSALGAWASSAAWYGLHGHLFAGRLAAVNSSLRVQASMKAIATSTAEGDRIHGSEGGRASEYYSMAKLMPSRPLRARYLALAFADIQVALASTEGDASGFLSIRGHISLMQGRPEDALSDFEAMKVIRENTGDLGAIGEALSDIGVVQMSLGNVRSAGQSLRRGREMLWAAGRYPFAIRAQKRVALADLRCGHPVRALKELCEAYDKAQEFQMFGQVTPLMETIHHLACSLGLWTPRQTR